MHNEHRLARRIPLFYNKSNVEILNGHNESDNENMLVRFLFEPHENSRGQNHHEHEKDSHNS